MKTQATLADGNASESVSLRSMSERRLMRKIRFGAVLTLLGLALALGAGAAQQAAPASGTTANSRPCSANPVLAPSGKDKHSQKTKYPVTQEPAPVCMEIKGEPIEVQEFLQTMAREQAWRIGENLASEDTWTFVRYFSADELENYADTKVLIETVKFTSGKAAVAVRTTDVGQGYVRVQITARFQGEGKSADRFSGQPATVWPLNSRGKMEKEMTAALQERYRHME